MLDKAHAMLLLPSMQVETARLQAKDEVRRETRQEFTMEVERNAKMVSLSLPCSHHDPRPHSLHCSLAVSVQAASLAHAIPAEQHPKKRKKQERSSSSEDEEEQAKRKKKREKKEKEETKQNPFMVCAPTIVLGRTANEGAHSVTLHRLA